MPPFIVEWLLQRTLSLETIEKFGIYWDGKRIVIPVHDARGSFLFNKYRRSPTEENAAIPKYQYDTGSIVVLYNEKTMKELNSDEPLFIVEGEFDCLALENIGLHAVSSTGGAGSFQPEWVEKFQNVNNIIICFDSDESGMKGAIKVQQLLPQASVLALPFKQGKDVTEFLQNNNPSAFFTLKSKKYQIPQDLKDIGDKKVLAQKVQEFKNAADTLLTQRQQIIASREYDPYIEFALEYVNKRYETYREQKKRFEARKQLAQSGVEIDVKQVPVDSIISFNNQGYAPCIWHNERTASMFYNNFQSKFPNTVKCFGCGAMGDVIDVVMQMHNLDFKEAVNFLKGK